MQRMFATIARRAALVGLAVASLVVVSACGAPAQEAGGTRAEDTITVRPRVAIDGLIELSARTGGRLFVDEVVFHAPSVQIRNGAVAIADVLATDPDDAGPLFFRYALADGGGAGAVASERHWRLDPAGASETSEVTFEFAPMQATDGSLDEILARTGWDLSALHGYTAYVHGYVSMDFPDTDVRTATRLGAVDRRAAGDAEGDPAEGDEMAGDAEGDPAEGTGEMAGDAEGDPAEGDEMAGDAEGDPAEGDEMAGDAEGDPAKGDEMAGDAEGDPADQKRASSGRDFDDGRIRRPGANASSGELVPFFLVFENTMELGVPLSELGVMELAHDEFLPIDLRVDVNRLLHDDRLKDLDTEAAAVLAHASEGFAILEVDPVDAKRAFAIDLDAVQKRTRAKDADKHLIELSGDPRDDVDGDANP